MRQFVKMRLKTITVDGIKRVELYINGDFIDDCEVNSQMSEREAKEFFRTYYRTGRFQEPITKENFKIK